MARSSKTPLVAAFALIVLLAAGVLVRQLTAGPRSAEDVASVSSPSGDLEPLWPAPEFDFVDQHGQHTTRASLAGHTWVANFIYTHCTSACPVMSAQLAKLQRTHADDQLRFVSFSVDPENDTPEVMAEYAKRWRPHEKRWLLLSTQNESLKRLAAGFHVAFERNNTVRDPVSHSSVFLLVDAKGMVRGAYDSADEEAMVRLAADVGRTASVTAAASGILEPQALYAALACAGCHTDKRLAPLLEGLLGRDVKLTTGKTVVADKKYIRQSIADANAQMVAGYLPLMPSYANVLSPEELDGLVELVAAGKANAPVIAEPPAEIVVDPICSMKVRVTMETPVVTDGEKTVYFCSDGCRTRYLAAHTDAH